MGYLKGKSALMIFEQLPLLRYKFGDRHFWCIGYLVSTVGINEATIVKYVREQEERDKITDQYSLVERPISFTSRKKHEVGMSRDRAILKGRPSISPL